MKGDSGVSSQIPRVDCLGIYNKSFLCYDIFFPIKFTVSILTISIMELKEHLTSIWFSNISALIVF